MHKASCEIIGSYKCKRIILVPINRKSNDWDSVLEFTCAVLEQKTYCHELHLNFLIEMMHFNLEPLSGVHLLL